MYNPFTKTLTLTNYPIKNRIFSFLIKWKGVYNYIIPFNSVDFYNSNNNIKTYLSITLFEKSKNDKIYGRRLVFWGDLAIWDIYKHNFELFHTAIYPWYIFSISTDAIESEMELHTKRNLYRRDKK